jgi:hypothetical protein
VSTSGGVLGNEVVTATHVTSGLRAEFTDKSSVRIRAVNANSTRVKHFFFFDSRVFGQELVVRMVKDVRYLEGRHSYEGIECRYEGLVVVFEV